MLHIVLLEPEIPQNTGNVGRMCALTGSRLHLIHPLGFVIDDRQLRRSGMDYWRSLDVHEHADWEAFGRSPAAPTRLWLLSRHAPRSFWDGRYLPGDGLLFGKESRGVAASVRAAVPAARHVYIDQMAPTLRSLNLATAAGIAAYEALRQWRTLPGAAAGTE